MVNRQPTPPAPFPARCSLQVQPFASFAPCSIALDAALWSEKTLLVPHADALAAAVLRFARLCCRVEERWNATVNFWTWVWFLHAVTSSGYQ